MPSKPYHFDPGKRHGNFSPLHSFEVIELQSMFSAFYAFHPIPNRLATPPTCLAILFLVGGLMGTGCSSGDPLSDGKANAKKAHDLMADVQMASAAEVAAFCGDCHVPPDASTYPVDHWPIEVQRGYQFYEKSGRHDLVPPDRLAVLKYYQSRAPKRLELPEPIENTSTSPVSFRKTIVSHPSGPVKPAVSNIKAISGGFLVCDMTSGEVNEVLFNQQTASVKRVAQVKAATHVEVVDFLKNGQSGLMVADIGDVQPEDHLLGGVYFFPGLTQQGSEADSNLEQSSIALQSSIGRVADIAVADFDGDNLLDCVVANFGYHETGSLKLVRQKAGSSTPVFETSVIDDRHGASHVFARDIDGDSDQDLVVLHSQEFEMVEAYLNDGTGDFERHILYNASVPDYGCSCIDVGDLDGDGDLDIVLSNGDSMDSYLLKPHQSIQWLENQTARDGELQFAHHSLGHLLGAYGCRLGDLDGDGDLDIAACVMTWDNSDQNTVVWYEQTEQREFTKHCLDLSSDQHACLELGDFDQDGDLDIAVGEFEAFHPLEQWVSVWWNEG